MQKRLLGIFSLLMLFGLFHSTPVAAFVGGEPGLARPSDSPLDHCQMNLAEALKSRDRERKYHAEKTRYAVAVAKSCGGEEWYDLDLLQCILLVPVFGLFLPFFGFFFIGTVRSIRKSSPAGRIKEEAQIPNAP